MISDKYIHEHSVQYEYICTLRHNTDDRSTNNSKFKPCNYCLVMSNTDGCRIISFFVVDFQHFNVNKRHTNVCLNEIMCQVLQKQIMYDHNHI